MFTIEDWIIDKLDVLLLLSILILTVIFYFVDPRIFLEKVSYAILAFLSLYEAIRIAKRGRGE
jgi:hypothetical protein